jgi:fructose-1,6-bisphosphatase/inositol monophosphatase family enzyme
MDLIPGLLLTQGGRQVASIKADGDATIVAELRAEDVVLDLIRRSGAPVRLHSEERGFLLNPAEPEYVVLLDPIDGTFLAQRALPGSCVAISVHEASNMRALAAVIGDYFTGDVYWATTAGAYRNGDAIKPSKVTNLNDAFVSTCYGKASRIGAMLENPRLVGTIAWTETTGSMLSMVRVGTGQVDAYWDLMVGYKPYDFAPAAFIAETAGAIVTDAKGNALRFPADLNERCKFIIAANQELHTAILRATAD